MDDSSSSDIRKVIDQINEYTHNLRFAAEESEKKLSKLGLSPDDIEILALKAKITDELIYESLDLGMSNILLTGSGTLTNITDSIFKQNEEKKLKMKIEKEDYKLHYKLRKMKQLKQSLESELKYVVKEKAMIEDSSAEDESIHLNNLKEQLVELERKSKMPVVNSSNGIFDEIKLLNEQIASSSAEIKKLNESLREYDGLPSNILSAKSKLAEAEQENIDVKFALDAKLKAM